ncbi:PREDICTED: ribosomal biogenesis protein LAS1L-like [Chrysochloris asiatica]|uniref:Ribosomal biogenesis protein LAS1L-like n=1 Tax=Chrysochloris asiatica TaxID=185453 RepID=A0A9B0TFX6_CHRAS|nr:PREDICTED: ribosomal biogenesis protein LAS1L-like [Chrysochloris asiatica]
MSIKLQKGLITIFEKVLNSCMLIWTHSDKGDKKEVQGSQCTQEASSCFVRSIAPKSKERCGIIPYEKKAAKLKDEKDIAAYQAEGKPDAAKNGVIKAEKSKNKKEDEEEEEEEEDEEDQDEG